MLVYKYKKAKLLLGSVNPKALSTLFSDELLIEQR